MNETQAKYLAGLLDADGSLSFTFKRVDNKDDRFYVGLALRLTASDVVDKNGYIASLPETIGFGSVTRLSSKPHIATWVVGKRSDLEMILPRISKHMVIKGAHWAWLLEQWREVRSGGSAVSLEDRERMTAESKTSRIARVGSIRPKNHPTWAWVAGYLDGDGCYHYRRGWNKRDQSWQYSMSVSVVSHVNDVCGLEFLNKAFGGTVLPVSKQPQLRIWRRSLGYHNRSFALRFLPKVAKHTKLKRPRIDALIHHHRQRLSVPGTERTFCTIDGCDVRVHGNGLCQKHYLQEWRSV